MLFWVVLIVCNLSALTALYLTYIGRQRVKIVREAPVFRDIPDVGRVMKSDGQYFGAPTVGESMWLKSTNLRSACQEYYLRAPKPLDVIVGDCPGEQSVAMFSIAVISRYDEARTGALCLGLIGLVVGQSLLIQHGSTGWGKYLLLKMQTMLGAYDHEYDDEDDLDSSGVVTYDNVGKLVN